MPTEIICRRFLVSGRVQGVFFRASTSSEARRLGLSGSATNFPDGRVEVIAIGPRGKVEELAFWLASGPPLARVTSVDAQNLNAAEWPRSNEFRTN